MKTSRLFILFAAIFLLLLFGLAKFYSLRAQENQHTLLPVMFANSYYANGQEREPNNNFEQANGPLSSGIDYVGIANDAYDIYYFSLAEPGPITAHVSSHQVESGQLLLFHEQNGQILSIGPRDYTPPDYHLNFWAEDIGTYYILLFIDVNQPYQTNTTYSLNVTYPVPNIPALTPTAVSTATSPPTPTSTALPLPSFTPTATQ